MTLSPGVADRAPLATALRRSAHALADLVRQAPDPDAAVPGLSWTVSDVAAHALTVVRRSLGDLRRSASPLDTAALNATCLQELPERDLHALADALAADADTVVTRVLPSVPDDDRPVPFHGGTTARLLDAYGIMLAELLVHGHDIAAAGEQPWAIPPAEAALAVQAVLALAPAWADPARWTDPATTLSIHVAGRRYDAQIGPDGTTMVGTPTTLPMLDPVEVLLALTGRGNSGDRAVRVLAESLLPL